MSTHYDWTRPTARKRHRCGLCYRSILPGEDYDRMAGLDDGTAWTYKVCRHCYRVSTAWDRAWGSCEDWDNESVLEWLQDEYPALYASLLAHWRYPDGELLPLPFPHRCAACRTQIPDTYIWCGPCDRARIERVSRQLEDLQGAVA